MIVHIFPRGFKPIAVRVIGSVMLDEEGIHAVVVFRMAVISKRDGHGKPQYTFGWMVDVQAIFSTMSRKSTRWIQKKPIVTFGMIAIISPSKLFRNCSSLL